ncbi:ATP-binding protein [Actinomycetospora cinnamomea]|uniref:histidine kinase n=1 Tax=Actinomycetospora cinnamomea TaxID=663609 RepID=A0A2U1FQ34_9PSEU|nr:ATP-binding protein [Actinomycetospora cinnamomea]PVZ14180.1 histidine kinase/DNA gyrase B/HSP90-like ATPase [Actinomycetospora cinnamomea]
MTGTLAATPRVTGGDARAAARPDDAGRGWVAAWWVVLAACAVLTLVWLVLGALVALAAHVPAIGAAVAGAEGTWSAGIVEAAALGEPAGQAVLDYLASAVNLAVAVVLWRRGGRTWTVRLLILAMIGSAGAFNLQAHAATLVVRRGSGLEIGELHQILLHGVASAAYVGALLLFPAGVAAARGGQRLLVGLAGIALFAAGVGTALLPHTVSCVVFFGFGVPLVGALGVSRHLRAGATPERRDQARLLATVLTGVLVTATVLALLTAVMAASGQPGLTLDDPTARHSGAGGGGGGEPTALLFWFARFSAAALALAVLAAYRPRLRASADRLHRALTVVVVVVAVGGTVALLATLAGRGPAGWVLGAAGGAAVYVAVSSRVDRVVERLLHGRRPTPYRVLLEVAEVSRTAAAGGDLDRLPEAVGRHLGARTVQLTARRPGLRPRTYRWRRSDAGDTAPADELVTFPVRHGTEEIGALSVDAEAVAGGSERHQLLADVADSLGAVLQAYRVEIELERQLRAAVSHGEQIATSRREAVAESDGERRAIERNLHDGAQHHLVSLRLSLGLVEHQVAAGKLDAARERLAQLAEQVDTAEAVLAETATGVSSATLADRGLVETLRQEVAGPDSTVTVDATGVPPGRRYGADVESAVYFCCLESVNNARKHAPGARVTVTLAEADGALRFAVRDEGPGFTPDPSAAGGGRGVRNVTTRVAAVGGTVALRSAPGAGTTVEGSIPLPDRAPATEDPDTDDPDTVVLAVPAVAAARDAPAASQAARDALAPSGSLAAGAARDAPAASQAARDALAPDTPPPASEPSEPSALLDAVRALVAGLERPPPVAMRLAAIADELNGPGPGTVRARRALDALDALGRAGVAGPAWSRRVLYETERTRLAGARETAQADLADALRRRAVVLPGGEQEAAERLTGPGPARARLGLASEASDGDVRRAAEEQLGVWRARATHPASTRTVRDAALVLAGVCEALLAET